MLTKSREKIGIFIVLLCGFTWGFTGILGQILFEDTNITVSFLSSIRMLSSGIIILVFLFFKDKQSLFSLWSSSKFIFHLFIFSILGVTSIQYTYFAAIDTSNAATATVLQYTYPILILLYTSICKRKMPKLYEIIAIFLAFIGIILTATHGNFSKVQISFTALFWGLASAFSFVVFTVYPKNLYKKFGIVPVMGWSFFIGGLVLFLFSGSFKMNLTLNSYSFGLIAIVSLLGTLIPFVIYGKGVEILGNVKASILVTIEPITSAILAFLLTDVIFTKIDILGFICILSSIELIALKSLKKDKN